MKASFPFAFPKAPLSGKAPLPEKAKDISWVDEFWERAGPYIFSREEDGILILPPNRVYKINGTGAALIRYLKGGGKISSLFEGGSLPFFNTIDKNVASFSGRRQSVEVFFRALAELYTAECDFAESAYAGRGSAEHGSAEHSSAKRGFATVSGAIETVPFTFDFSRLPILGEVAVTYRCNNNCLFCYAGCGTGFGGDSTKKDASKDISTEEWKKIIGIFKNEARIPFFSFSGGEPLLRGDLEELASYATSLGLEVNLVSNGTLVDEARASSLFAAGLRTAQISIEAPEAGLHDFLAGRSGAFDETVRGIKALMKAGVSVQTNTTITHTNRETAVEMPLFLAGLGIRRFAMNMYIPAGLKAGKKARDDLAITYDEIRPVVDGVRKAAFAAGLTFYWYSPTPFCFFNPIARGMGNKSCAALDGLISVAADGSLLPCSSWDEPLGNLLEKPFEELWFSDRALFFKHKHFAPAKCSGRGATGGCSAFTACQGACPIYWQSYGYGLLSGAGIKPARNKRENAKPPGVMCKEDVQ